MAAETVRAQIRAQWPFIIASAQKHGFRFSAEQARLPAKPKLLGSSHKVRLGESIGVLTSVVYLSPAKESGINTCPFRAGCGCEQSCIGSHSGQLALPMAKRARLWKTALVFGAPALARELLHCEIRAHVAKAARLGLRPAIRLDGSSDLGWGAEFSRTYGHECVFYDYTKSARRAFASLGTAHHVTLSATGRNDAECVAYLRAGGTVAVVLPHRTGQYVPTTWNGFPTLDGDASDVRFLDAPGHVVALSFKRASKRDSALERARKTGFVSLPVIH